MFSIFVFIIYLFIIPNLCNYINSLLILLIVCFCSLINSEIEASAYEHQPFYIIIYIYYNNKKSIIKRLKQAAFI